MALVTVDYPVPAAAVGVDKDTLLPAMPYTAALSNVYYIPSATITATGGNRRLFTLSNYDVGISLATRTMSSSDVFPAGVEQAVGLVGGRPAPVIGERLMWTSERVGGSGSLADPGGIVRVIFDAPNAVMDDFTDPTPNDNYAVAGVNAGAPTPETDAAAELAAREALGLTGNTKFRTP